MTITEACSRALMTIVVSTALLEPAGAQGPGDDVTARAGQPNSAAREAQPATKWSLCGSGSYQLTAAGQSIGSETFEVTCRPDGHYLGTGRTQLSAGAMSLDLTTNLELAQDLVPITASAKGTVQGQPFDQTGTFTSGTAALSTNGNAQSVPYTPGASWSGGNIFFPIAFLAARYDEAKGGVQQFPVFPTLSASLERVTSDGLRADNGESATFTRFIMRLAGAEMVLWRDSAGRLAVMAVVAQRFTVARPEAAKWIPALLSSLSAPSRASSGSAVTPESKNATDYSAPANAPFTAEEATIPVSTYTLAGTLLVPKSGTRPFAAVVMISGSGLQTRDSRIALPGLEQYAPFRQIAERLASDGVAVLRADDRGVGGSTGRETLENATTTSLAEDTRAQIAWLRGRREIDPQRIIVIGHSEGASIAAMVGASDPKVSALVLMAGVGKRGADVSIEQQEDMLRSDTTMSEATRASLRAQQKEAVKTILAGGDVPGQKFNAWTREYFSYDPLVTIRKVKQPMLILQGERDRQVDQSHATLLANAAREAGNTRVTLRVFPTLNHLFLPSKTGSFSEYSHLETSVVPSVVLDAIADWMGTLRN